ncbi:MAG TPA: tetratricopeptide repeat protein, partial [Acidobacteriota bacterium]|nr:tetratricopeptide repeat protein [Acidobacteriota bacterium]
MCRPVWNLSIVLWLILGSIVPVLAQRAMPRDEPPAKKTAPAPVRTAKPPAPVRKKAPPAVPTISAETYVTRGHAALKENLYDQAIAEYTAALNINPDLMVALIGLGNAHLKKGSYTSDVIAIFIFTEVLKRQPVLTEVLLNRAALYLKRGNF